jgi:hypothetical protein
MACPRRSSPTGSAPAAGSSKSPISVSRTVRQSVATAICSVTPSQLRCCWPAFPCGGLASPATKTSKLQLVGRPDLPIAASTSAGRTTASTIGEPRGQAPGPKPNRSNATLRTSWPGAPPRPPPRTIPKLLPGQSPVYRRQKGPRVDPRPHQEVHALAGATADVLRGTRSLRCKGRGRRFVQPENPAGETRAIR